VTGIFHIVLARKPLEGTIAENCLQWGCGAINIDGTRISMSTADREDYEEKRRSFAGVTGKAYRSPVTLNTNKLLSPLELMERSKQGRWPANLVVGGEEVVGLFPETMSIKGKPRKAVIKNQTRLKNSKNTFVSCEYDDSGSASRFFFNFSEQESDE